MADPFIGEVRVFGFNFAPRNWAHCDGQVLQIEQNSTLFAIIGSIYGGDWRTTVGIPDLRGRAPMHYGFGPGLSPRTLGEYMGNWEIELEQSHMPSHTHTATAVKTLGTATNPTGGYPGIYSVSVDDVYKKEPTGSTPMSSNAMALAGKSYPHSNLQPYLAANFCMCLDGIFPSRN